MAPSNDFQNGSLEGLINETDTDLISVLVTSSSFAPQTTTTDDVFLNGSSITPPSCNILEIDRDFEIPFLVVASVACLVGIVYTFLGYRCFKIVLFLTGFAFGSLLIYLICTAEDIMPVWGNAGVALGAGILLGIITTVVHYVGLFMTGFLTGLFIGVLVILIMSCLMQISTVWITVGVVFGCGLVFALVILKFQRIMMIVCTSLLGAALLAAAADFFVENFYSVWQIVNVLRVSNVGFYYVPTCLHQWLVLGLWPLLALIGVVLQARCTSRGFDHKQGTGLRPHLYQYRRQRLNSQSPKRETPGSSGSSTRQSSRDRPSPSINATGTPNTPQTGSNEGYAHKPFRLIYQHRRAKGDVICQSYLESLQRLAKQRAEESQTLASDQTRLTVLTGTNRSNASDESLS